MLSAKDSHVLEAIFNSIDGEIVLHPTILESKEDKRPPVDMELDATIRQLETDGVAFADLSKLEEALECFNRAIDLDPSCGSAYNNRAQVLRLMNRNEDALADIEKAIEFGSLPVLRNAYTQRAVLKRALGDEIGADQDFAKGAQYGNPVAKEMVKSNPYAKLCNNILIEAMKNSTTMNLKKKCDTLG